MKAALYGRYSTDQQRAASIEDQFRNCRKRAEAEGWTVVREFQDHAITGSRADRGAYQDMLKAAATREFDVLLVDDLSRLGRDQDETNRAIKRLKFQGLRVMAVSDGYDSNTKTEKVYRTVKNLTNEIFLDDLRDKTHRGLTGQAMKQYWCGGKPYGYRLKPIADPSRLDQYGNPSRIGTKLEPDKGEAIIVQEIFGRFAEGASCKMIASELNGRRIPSPGASWKRTTRRAEGWMSSGLRALLRNEIYTGAVVWNKTEWLKDPDSGMRARRNRPQAEWITWRDESLRIVSDELWQRVQRRWQKVSDDDPRLKGGGKPRYLLSGLLFCGECDRHYIMCNALSYACSSHIGGHACSNSIHVRRSVAEDIIVGPIFKELLSPERVAKMTKEMQSAYAEHVLAVQSRAASASTEMQELEARIERLRKRLTSGDPDMAPDELQAAIERAESKRQELLDRHPIAKQTAQMFAALPRAAELYRRQIALGLNGHPREAGKARVILREMFGGKIRLEPNQNGELWANYGVRPTALLRAVGTHGSGAAFCAVPIVPVRVRVR